MGGHEARQRRRRATGVRAVIGLGEQDWVLVGGDAELVVEGVVPELHHVVLVGDDAVLDRVLEGEDTTLGLDLVPDVRVLVAHADHPGGQECAQVHSGCVGGGVRVAS